MNYQVDVLFAEGYSIEDAPDEDYAIKLAKELFYDTYPNLKGHDVDVHVYYRKGEQE